MKSATVTTELMVQAGLSAVKRFSCRTSDREEHVEAYIQGYFDRSFAKTQFRVPIQRQVTVTLGPSSKGRVDLLAKGVNPKPVEVAAQPERGKSRNRLYPSQNRREVTKLLAFSQEMARQRALLLLDYDQRPFPKERLMELYRREFAHLQGSAQVRVIYCHRSGAYHFELFSRERRRRI